ncbi:hypothetical protein QAD02_012240 [Eretmocerus hayati]|uniref:Uncharacterized protein n=1 Tax=Eretmocerus hayati TaxID=131215 RepID=A0ACC2P015_9HYME|nr:hypothetical protein QAD02_012240 [Eretmocerus hayati]
MVAGKSEEETLPGHHHQSGDSEQIKSNLNISPPLSYGEIEKSKEDDPMDLATKNCELDESDDIRNSLNTTYSCSKPDSDDCLSGDSVKIDEADVSSESKNNDAADEHWFSGNNITYRNRQLFSLTSSFNIFDDSKLNITKMDVSTIDNSDVHERDTDDSNSILIRARNYLAEYQGLPHEEYTFSSLIKVLGQAVGRCLLALFYTALNVIPVLEIFVHISRFIVDKLIDIKNTPDIQQIVLKTAIFLFQLLCVYFGVIFIFGCIVMPFLKMTFSIFTKIIPV